MKCILHHIIHKNLTLTLLSFIFESGDGLKKPDKSGTVLGGIKEIQLALREYDPVVRSFYVIILSRVVRVPRLLLTSDETSFYCIHCCKFKKTLAV